MVSSDAVSVQGTTIDVDGPPVEENRFTQSQTAQGQG
jgi:hypothetical protein